MEASSVAFYIGALLGLLYVGMGLAALFSVPTDKKHLISSSLPTFFFWWPFYKSMFDESSSKLRMLGAIALVLLILSYASSAALKSVGC
ncbi:hypothetical protein CK486_04505 [Pseudomonas sp. HAR-UPW-AIA-41]|nr:hypothetical protein CK486_04505 [Pseudomonas sp. HAR-UPW-AIA-41]